ncbi:MAG: hypothetical protein ACRDQZ_20390 [Mycobacteriales bacterium]
MPHVPGSARSVGHRIGTHIASHRHRHVSRRLLVVLVVIVLLVPAGVLAARSLAISLLSDGPDSENSQFSSAAAHKKVASSVVDANPFRGTPADKFASGEAGIVVPVAKQQGSWSADAVADVLNKTKAVLTSARLDEAMLLQGQTQPYLDQLSESSRDFVGKQLATPSALAYVTRLAPGYTLRAPVRVHGAMNVTVGNAGQLIVSANYVWVYPLRAPKATKVFGLAGSQLVVLHTVERYEFYPEKGYAVQNRGLRPGDGEQHIYNADCGTATDGKLALPSNRNRKPGAPVKLAYDRNASKNAAPGGCGKRE